MPLQFFNTLSRSVQTFLPLDPGGKDAGLYCCGPTVYDYAHIGNWRTFVFADLVRRYLQFKGFHVRHVMNITDVEDKIIKAVREKNTSLSDFTRKYEAAFLEDLKTLNCLVPNHLPRATEHIAEIQALITKLMDRGIAYQATDGSIYFSIERYQSSGAIYGQLLKLDFDALRTADRVKADEYEKDAVADFALWKRRVAEDGNVFWPSPWGDGRPGWHIECSAMSIKTLGPSFDIHVGGEDLIFPHHEDEIAQSEGSGEVPQGSHFVKYWLHAAHLMVNGRKMSKTLGNFFTLRDLLQQQRTGREIRFALLQAHYRETFNFSVEGLDAARASLQRVDECIGKLQAAAKVRGAAPSAAPELVENFAAALDEDFNVSKSWACVFDWVKKQNRLLAAHALTPEIAATELLAWEKINSVLGLAEPSPAAAPADINSLMEQRQEARRSKDFKRADQLRAELAQKGWAVDDTPEGPKAKRL